MTTQPIPEPSEIQEALKWCDGEGCSYCPGEASRAWRTIAKAYRSKEQEAREYREALEDILKHAEPHQYEGGAVARGFLQVVVAKAEAVLRRFGR